MLGAAAAAIALAALSLEAGVRAAPVRHGPRAERICRPSPPAPNGTKSCLVIGDSVSLGYAPFLAAALAGERAGAPPARAWKRSARRYVLKYVFPSTIMPSREFVQGVGDLVRHGQFVP